MKKALAVLIVFLLIVQSLPFGTATAADSSSSNISDPISHGRMNTVTYVYWGKSELFPRMGMVGPNDEFDVYEYDENWVMILYDTYVTQGYTGSAHSFFGYVKRNEITCDPQLEEGSSAKADTGPGKRKGKKPKTPKPTDVQSTDVQSTAAESTGKSEETGEPEPSVPVNEDEEFDWIIRTPGICSVTVPVEEAVFTCSFALMAQKAGGVGPSSDPAFNHGMHTPYAATVFFGMVSPMSDYIKNLGEASNFLSGSGGIDISGQAAGSTFYLDTGALDPALVNFSVTLQATATFDPSVTDGNLTVNAGTFSTSQSFPLPVQLKKAGKGYRFILKGMKPGGGDLEFPAVLEKTFSDPEKWDKAARDEDKRRAEAERLRKKLLEKIRESMKKEQEAKAKAESSKQTDFDSLEGIDLAPLDPLDGVSLTEPDPLDGASLTEPDPLDGASLTDSSDEALAPLWPAGGEGVSDFPSGNN
jgi:hypothetical protein